MQRALKKTSHPLLLINLFLRVAHYDQQKCTEISPVSRRLPASHLSSAVVYELHGPAALVLNPDKNPAVCVTRGQFLERLVPSHQNHLLKQKETEKTAQVKTDKTGLS